MDKLVLFDIDKTLMESSRWHRAAFSEAFRIVYRVDTTIDIISTSGLTDQQIIIEVLKRNGLDEKRILPKIKECMKIMVTYVNKTIKNDDAILLDGVKDLLGELDKRNVLMGLVTGNLKPIAEARLNKAGVGHYFKVGGFGSDDIKRANLVKLAISRAKTNFNFRFDNNVFLVGDTPRDIEAGRVINVKTIGVATGIYSKEELKSSGADFVLENLKDKNEFLEIIER